MKIINLGRGQGKTVRLLYASEWNDIPIVCATDSQKQHLIDMAKRLGLNIPEPIVTWEIKSSRVIDNRMAEKDLLVDEAPLVLRSLLHSMGMKGEVRAITLTSDELKREILRGRDMKLLKDLNDCKSLRKEYRIKPTIKFFADKEHYYFSFLPTILWVPWVYRYPNSEGVIDIWWLNFHILIGTWERIEV